MPRILFVEDEQALLDTVQRFFSREGFDVYTARSLSEAMETYSRYAPDVVILDVMLNEGPEPQRDGFDVCRALRNADYDGPVIFVTAKLADLGDAQIAALRINAVISKPFSPREMVRVVEDVLEDLIIEAQI